MAFAINAKLRCCLMQEVDQIYNNKDEDRCQHQHLQGDLLNDCQRRLGSGVAHHKI